MNLNKHDYMLILLALDAYRDTLNKEGRRGTRNEATLPSLTDATLRDVAALRVDIYRHLEELIGPDVLCLYEEPAHA